MITKKYVFFLGLFLIYSIAFSSNSAQTINIKIIETSDVHGAIMPYDLLNDTTTNSSLAQVHTYAVAERYQPNQEVILLDNGDILQGDPLVYYYNYEDTVDTHVYAEAMNFMSYDAATIGNHDIETGHSVYDRFRKEISFPWLAANAIDTKTGELYFEPYTIIERKGIKIAVLGLTTPYIPNWLPEILWEGIEFEDMVKAAEKWISIIKENEKPDLIIGLFHSGVDYNYNNEKAEIYENENASRLVAEQIPGFDIVFVGHDHVGWNFKIENSGGDSVLILGSLSRAKTVAVANIQMEFDRVGGKWNKKSISGEIVEVKNYRHDDHFMSNFLINLNVAKNYVQKPLGQITQSISSKESLFGPSAFVDLIQTAQLELAGADISFVSPLSFNATIDSGWIKVKDMFKLYHYENCLYTIELSGQEIKDYLEYSFGNWFNEMRDENDHLLKFKYETDGTIKYSERYGTPELEERYYNYSTAAGIYYTVDVSKPFGNKVTITALANGAPFNLSKKYTVAVNSYRGSGGGGHLTRGAGIPQKELLKRVLTSTDKDLRYYLMKWIEEKKTINPDIISTWQVIPPTWWEFGRKKDYEILFGTTAPEPEKKLMESKIHKSQMHKK
ncbi:MAG: bifunctional metallophosphatase/5'-nucleotidase [Ignavibacteriaceae bacterium]|nr:bifunctional metallophosphatase/5'-nucleotidase [Ignavibacteriaceae bacterium]